MIQSIPVAKNSKQELALLGRMANRHGLIAGATGTGKTVTLKVLAEGFSKMGVPVFLADVKGDLAGMCAAGSDNPQIAERVSLLGLPPLQFQPAPVVFWDVFGEAGHPVRATISEMGPLLLSRLMNLNETQAGVLSIVFRVADDHGFLLLDLKDLRAMVEFVGERAKEYTTQYGNISVASIGAIQRGLLMLEDQGAELYFGEPALDIADLMQSDPQGRGIVNILAADKLMHSPKLYGTFLLWLLSELFERLPEAGDLEKPKMVFFFDEAHLLFDDAPDAVLEKVEQVVRLVRSKGVGIYFITQNPLDVPDRVLSQLGNRVQHALRAFTAKDQKAVRAAAQTFRTENVEDTEKAITELAIGEALISFLDDSGTPGFVQRAFVYPPVTRMGAISPEERRAVIQSSTLYPHYEETQDRESAYEKLKAKAPVSTTQATPPPIPAASDQAPAQQPKAAPRGRATATEAFVTSTVRSIGASVGRQIVRGIFGTFSRR